MARTPFKISRYATEHYHWPSSLNQSEKSHGAKENRLHLKYLTIYRYKEKEVKKKKRKEKEVLMIS